MREAIGRRDELVAQLTASVEEARVRAERLSATDVLNRLEKAEQRITGFETAQQERLVALGKQIDSLAAIIDPKNAGEILTVARMRDEILAREAMETRLNVALDKQTELLTRLEDKIQVQQYWIWGVLTATIGGLAVACGYMAVEHFGSRRKAAKGAME